MNRGQARRKTDETGWEDALAPFPSLDAPPGTPSVVPVSSTRRARSSAETLRGAADPFADTQAALPGGAAACRDWCVDRGDELLTMTTFELWAAIERADVAPWMRVWREGMECWTAASELIELSWAVAGTPQPSLETEASTGPPPPAPPPASARQVSRAPAPSMPPEPLPSPRQQARSRVQPHAARWVAVGSLVAATAIAAAFFVAAGGDVEVPVEHGIVASPPPARALPARALPTVASSPRPVEPARREDRGQRRLPRGGGRPYGR